MRRLLVALSVLLILPLSASAWMSPLVCSGGGQSAAGCSTPTGNVLSESFGDDSTACYSGGVEACIKTWTLSGDSATFQHELQAGMPTGSCTYGLLSDTADAAESGERVYWDKGSPVAYDTNDVDIEFSFYLNSATIANYASIYIIAWGSNNAGAITDAFTVYLFNDDGTIEMGLETSGTDPTKTALSTGTWYTINIHLDATAASSYYTVNGGSQNSFTRYDVSGQYFVIGSLSDQGDGEAVSFEMGYLKIDVTAQ